MKYKAVIFDLDGTLLNTLDDIADSMNFALRSVGFVEHSVDDYREIVGNGVINLVKSSIPQEFCNDEETIKMCFDLLCDEYKERWDRKTCLYKGIADMLDGLQKLSIPLNILSNKPDEFVQEIVDKFLDRWSFANIFGARDGVAIKPDPISAIEIAKNLNIVPSDIIYVGDSDVDIKTAISAEMFPVGVSWGFRNVTELFDNGAEIVLGEPLELLRIVG